MVDRLYGVYDYSDGGGFSSMKGGFFMNVNAVDFAGLVCGRVYEKELETEFLERLIFYIDGRIRFERYCHGEAAGLVCALWANGFDEDGKISWIDIPKYGSLYDTVPRILTDIQEDGNALQFDGQFRRFIRKDELRRDSDNGYGRLRLLWLRHKKK